MSCEEITTWEEYEKGMPQDGEKINSVIASQLLELRQQVNFLTACLFGDDGGDDKPGGGGDGGGKKVPKPDGGKPEVPETGPVFDAPNYKAKVRAIRTDAKGNYEGTTLEALVAIPRVIAKGGLLRLRNKNWEQEFKRAQSAGLTVCLRISDKAVQAIEILS